LCGEEFEVKKYNNRILEAMYKSITFSLFVGLSQGGVFFAMFCNYALSFWFGAKLIDI
jgi:ATP-binding cassette subfamily B (MDR/TAP) protein 1